MKKLLFLLVMPLAAFSSTVYTFSFPRTSPTLTTGGFTYISADYVRTSSITLGTQDFASCDLSGFTPDFICANAILTQLPGSVRVDALFLDTLFPNDPSGRVLAEAYFNGASLQSDGTYHATALSQDPLSTFTIQTTPTAAPEPSTWILFGTGLLGTWFWKRRQAK